jgi:hypothetical protein
LFSFHLPIIIIAFALLSLLHSCESFTRKSDEAKGKTWSLKVQYCDVANPVQYRIMVLILKAISTST